jgi:hypothetical protein
MSGISGKPKSPPALLPLMGSQESDGEGAENLDSSDNRSLICDDLFCEPTGEEEEHSGILLGSKTSDVNSLRTMRPIYMYCVKQLHCNPYLRCIQPNSTVSCQYYMELYQPCLFVPKRFRSRVAEIQRLGDLYADGDKAASKVLCMQLEELDWWLYIVIKNSKKKVSIKES